MKSAGRFAVVALLSGAPAAAGWSPPNPAELARLERALAAGHAEYDPAEQMLRRPYSTNGGDRHISLDRIKDGRFRARDLRLRFEFGGPAAKDIQVAQPANRTVTLRAGDLDLRIEVSAARFGATEGKVITGREHDGVQVDVVLHDGEERAFDLTTLDEAVVAFGLSVGPPARVGTRREGNSLTIESAGIATTVNVKPAPRR